jgi:hypothetical protein
MKSVKSSHIQAVGYVPESKTLNVTFHNGQTYQYSGVPESEYKALLAAPSPGGHFIKNIKSKFKNRKV